MGRFDLAFPFFLFLGSMGNYPTLEPDNIHSSNQCQQSRTSESCKFCTPPRCDFLPAGPSTRKPSAKILQKMVVV